MLIEKGILSALQKLRVALMDYEASLSTLIETGAGGPGGVRIRLDRIVRLSRTADEEITSFQIAIMEDWFARMRDVYGAFAPALDACNRLARSSDQSIAVLAGAASSLLGLLAITPGFLMARVKNEVFGISVALPASLKEVVQSRRRAKAWLLLPVAAVATGFMGIEPVLSIPAALFGLAAWLFQERYFSQRHYLGAELPTRVAAELTFEVARLDQQLEALDNLSADLLRLEIPEPNSLADLINRIESGKDYSFAEVTAQTRSAEELFTSVKALIDRIKATTPSPPPGLAA